MLVSGISSTLAMEMPQVFGYAIDIIAYDKFVLK